MRKLSEILHTEINKLLISEMYSYPKYSRGDNRFMNIMQICIKMNELGLDFQTAKKRCVEELCMRFPKSSGSIIERFSQLSENDIIHPYHPSNTGDTSPDEQCQILLETLTKDGEIQPFGTPEYAKQYVKEKLEEYSKPYGLAHILKHGKIKKQLTLLGQGTYNENGLLYVERSITLNTNDPLMNYDKSNVGLYWSWRKGGASPYCSLQDDTPKTTFKFTGYVSPNNLIYSQIIELLYDPSVSWQDEVRIKGELQLNSIEFNGKIVTPSTPKIIIAS